MRLARIAHPQGFAFVEVRGEVSDPSSLTCAEISEHPFGTPEFTGREWPLADVRLLAPILASKIVCVGKNYADHAAEMGSEAPAEPLIFLKPNTSVIGPEAAIAYPPSSERVDYEGELAVVIGQPCRDVAAARAHEVILGYTCANDVTARDQQQADGQWTRGKGYDTFCPLGPWIETDLDPASAPIRTRLNGRVMQESNTSDLIFSCAELIAFLSAGMTLLPGTVIMTGTPSGVGFARKPPVFLRSGDVVEIEVEGIGVLRNPVA